MPVTISLAATPDHREEVFRLRYTVLVEEMHRTPGLADHYFRRIEEPLDLFARFLVARHDRTVIGALRVNLLSEGEIEAETQAFNVRHFREAYPHGIAVSAPPLVVPGFRNSNLALRLVRMAYTMELNEGITHDFVRPEPGTESFYLELGYRPYPHPAATPMLEHPTTDPLVLVLRDDVHLAQVNSPLREEWREHFGPAASGRTGGKTGSDADGTPDPQPDYGTRRRQD